MKNKSFFFVLLFFFYFLFSFKISLTQGYSSEKIDTFLTKIKINKDSSILVKESILYDFGSEFKHGIYRTIPVKNIKIKVLEVTDEFNNPYQFKTRVRNGILTIQIGDPQKTIAGQHQYNITYQVFNALNFLKDHDELYWNVIGNDWKIPILKVEAEITFPEKIPSDKFKMDCFTGYIGSKEKNCQFSVKEDGKILFQANNPLDPTQGLTIVFGWPKGIIKKPNIFQKFFWLFPKYLPFLIPIFIFIFLFQEWYRKGRDLKIEKPIVVEYQPPDNLRPAEMDFILNEDIEPKDIAATIIDLAVRGFLKIREVEDKVLFFEKKDYEIEKLKDDGDLLDYEKLLLEKLFQNGNKIQILSLKNEFFKNYKDYEEFKEKIANLIMEKGYFERNPLKIINRLTAVATLIFFGMYFISAVINDFSYYFSGIISGVIISIFAALMSKKTKKGIDIYKKILGFEEYIQNVEKYRAQFYEKENIFEEYLPYAIIFDVANKWTKAFENLFKEPPSWYEGNFTSAFTVAAFTSSLNNYISQLISFSKSSGLGGGSSGGGRGGGGGGSW
jgi:uncharacterized membrane protein